MKEDKDALSEDIINISHGYRHGPFWIFILSKTSSPLQTPTQIRVWLFSNPYCVGYVVIDENNI